MFDKTTYKKYYQRFYPRLLVYGKTITPDTVIIEDTIQELFLSLWERGTDLTEKKSLDSYFFVAFRNNLLRKMKTVAPSQLLPDLAAPTAPGPRPEEEKLSVLLNDLPLRQQEVIFLRYYENLPYQEIAARMGISYQSARNFSYRAIQFLKNNLKTWGMLALLPGL